MQKTVVMYLLLISIFTTTYAHNKEKDNRIEKLTRDAISTDLIQSPNGKWIAFVKKSTFTVPKNCFYFFAKGDHANEIWVINTEKMTKKILVAPRFNCTDVSTVILDPHNLQFSPDSKTLYFETSAWVTSGAIHAVDISGNHLRFVTDGSALRVVQAGTYKSNLIVDQHRYRFKGDTPLGSYDGEWLFTPAGKEIKLYKEM